MKPSRCCLSRHSVREWTTWKYRPLFTKFIGVTEVCNQTVFKQLSKGRKCVISNALSVNFKVGYHVIDLRKKKPLCSFFCQISELRKKAEGFKKEKIREEMNFIREKQFLSEQLKAVRSALKASQIECDLVKKELEMEVCVLLYHCLVHCKHYIVRNIRDCHKISSVLEKLRNVSCHSIIRGK